VYRITEDMIMEFLPPGVEGGVSYCCGYERLGVNRRTAHILKNSASLSKFFDFLSGLEEFMQKQSWGHLATSELPSHQVGLIIFISTMVQPSSTEFSRQNAWADDDIEDLQESSILAFSFKGELTRESQIVIIQIREPERILETFEEELEELADILLDEDS
jgi:hypothetical protein